MKKTYYTAIHTIPPGQYIISDECYIYPHNNDEADKARDLTMEAIFNDPNNPNKYERCARFETEFGPLIINGTAFGDGCYPLRHKGVLVYDLPVDAGNISLIPFKYALKFNPKLTFSNQNPMTPDNHSNHLGFYVEFKKETKLYYEDGDWTVGDYSVKTND